MISGFCFALRGNVAYCGTSYMVCIILLDRVYYCYSIRCPENILPFGIFFVRRSVCSYNFLSIFLFLSSVLDMRRIIFGCCESRVLSRNLGILLNHEQHRS